MDIITGQEVHDKIKKAMAGADKPPATGNFWDPLNELDPHAKAIKPGFVQTHKFKHKVFAIFGGGDDAGDSHHYDSVMNSIFAGKFIKLQEDTYNNKDGDITVLLRWLEPIDPAVIEQTVTKTLDNFFEDETPPQGVPDEKKKKRKRRSKDQLQSEKPNDFTDMEETPE